MKQVTFKTERRVKTFLDFDMTPAQLKKRDPRKADVKLLIPEENEAAGFFGDNLEKWALHGYAYYLKQRANAALAGGTSGDPELKKLMRLFSESFRTYVREMEIPKDEALKTLSAKERYAPIKDTVLTVATAGDMNLDYTTDPPTPGWFEGKVVKDETGKEVKLSPVDALISNIGEEDDEDESEKPE